MDSAPPNKGSSDKTVWIVLGIVGGFLFLCGGLAVVIVVCIFAITALGSNASGTFDYVSTKVSSTSGGVSHPNTAEGRARQFCSDIDVYRFDDAYDRFSTNRRQLTSRQAFQADIERHGPLRKSRTFTLRPSTRRNDANAFDATFEGYDDARVDVTVLMTNENGTWKVDEFLIWDEKR